MAHIAEKFQQAAQRQDPAVFNFKREVAQAWRDFPEVKNKIIFLNASSGAKLIYPAGTEERKKMDQWVEQWGLPRYLENYNATHQKNSFCLSVGNGMRFLFLLMEKHPHDVLNKAAPVAQDTTFAFDHELGHAVIFTGLPADGSPNMAECVADAYALIRHFQRYGADSPAVEDVVANRAFDLVFRNSGYGHDHFTSPVTEKILACRHDIDWDSLTPEQTTQMARKFVLEHEMEAEALRVLDKDFGQLHDKAKDIENGDAAPLQALAEKVLSTNSSSVFKYGAAALKLCIDQQTAGAVLTGEYWDDVRQKLAEKQKTFAQPKPVLSAAGVPDHPVRHPAAPQRSGLKSSRRFG